jgi:hypothetical protein
MPHYTYTHEVALKDHGGAILEMNVHSVELDRPAKERDEPVVCQQCKVPMKRALAKVAPPTVMERVDQHRNVKQRQNNAERVAKRAKKFFVENEMPGLIGEHGAEHAKRVGWVKPDGKVVKTDDLK